MASNFKVTVCNCVKPAEHKIDNSQVMILLHDDELAAARICRQINDDNHESHPSRESYAISKQQAEALYQDLSDSSELKWSYSQKKPFCHVVVAPEKLMHVRSVCIGSNKKGKKE